MSSTHFDEDLISVTDEMIEPDENFLYLKI